MEFTHVPVLLEECIEGLDIKPDGVYVDGTAGGAGHSSAIAARLGENGRLIALDRPRCGQNRFRKAFGIPECHGDTQQLFSDETGAR